MKIHIVTLLLSIGLQSLAHVSHADLIDDKLPKGHSEIHVNAERDATTTLFVEATRNGKNPIGLLTSTADTFINDGTTTEYMTQHRGTYIDEKYAKIESTSTREYYYVKGTQGAVGLVSASSNFEVHSGKTTEVTVQEYRTYIDGNYAHLVSSKLNIYSDPSSFISATPVYRPDLLSSSNTLFPREYYDIDPSKPKGIPTRTIGEYPIKKELVEENVIEQNHAELNADLNAIRPRSIENGEIRADSVVYSDPTIPTFTVSGDGELDIPVIEDVSPLENEVEPENHLRGEHSVVKPSKTILDSVTYIGFVDFTTTIDDTVVIFKPKKTYNTVSKSLIMHKIVPTQSVSLDRQPIPRKEAIIVDQKIIEHEVLPNQIFPNHAQSSIVPTPSLGSSIPERHRTSEPEVVPSSPVSIPKITSGINPLKKLLESRRNKFNKLNPTSQKSQRISSTSLPETSDSEEEIIKEEKKITVNKETPKLFNTNSRPKINLRPGAKASGPPSISSSIDTESNVELVYKTLYTTYTYFTTFFRASTTRIKSREDIVSNVVTLTNILKPSDLESLKKSCEIDSTCVFATTDPAKKSKGFIGRPNKSIRASNARHIESSPINQSVEEEEGSLLKTFYTTYTYFTTLFLDGTSSISTRTEVYSNIKSSGVPIDSLNKEPSRSPTSVINFQSTASKVLDDAEFTSSSRKLEYSSIERGRTTTESPEEETESTISSTSSEDLTTVQISPSATLKGQSEEEIVTNSQVEEVALSPTPDLESAKSVPEASTSIEPVVKTYFTTFTYFTTLFRNGTSTVTSNLETITNVGTSSPSLSSSFTPSVTFFTTFTYWTTLIDGDNTITSSSEETRTDILPASVTQDIVPPQEKVLFTARPDSPSVDSSQEKKEEDSDKESTGKKNTKSNRTFTPAIRPNFIRPRGRPASRLRDPPSRTTVAIITRSDVTPTLIATPVTSPIQPTPTFEEELKSVSISSEEEVTDDGEELESSTTESTTKANSLIRPTILSGIRLRRPNPFKDRLRERQRQHLKKIRGNIPRFQNNRQEVEEEEEIDDDEDLEPQTTPASGNRRRNRPSFTRNTPRFSFPRTSNGRAPIFVSSRTERFDRRKNEKESESEETFEVTETTPSFTTERSQSTVPNHISKLRERARARINSLFSRRSRPSNRFNIFSSRNKAEDGEDLEESPVDDEGGAPLSRKKRQVNPEFGSRTRNRQTFVLRRRQRNKPVNPNDDALSPQHSSYKNSLPDTSSPSSSLSKKTQISDNSYYDFYSSNFNKDPATATSSNINSSSNTSKRQVRQQSAGGFKPRSGSRFTSRARQRLRSRTNNNSTNERFKSSRFGSSSSSSSSSSSFRNEPKKAFRDRFRPKTRGGFRRTTPRPFKNNFEYDYDDVPELQSSQQQNSVPDFITVTHFIPLQTTIPVKERGVNTFRDILTTSPSLEVIAANSLKSTEVNNSPVIYANAITNTPNPGVKEITYQALRATETTQVIFTPTRIRGIRTSFSHVLPTTIYNIQPVSTKIVDQVNQNDLLSTLLIQLLGGAVNKSPGPLALAGQQPQVANLLGGGNGALNTRYVTHTSTYVTTISTLDSTIVTITLRGREVKTTLVESQTEVVTATELSTETIIKPTPAGLNGLGAGLLQTQAPLGGLNNLPGLGLPDLKQQLLAAQLQQQLFTQQKQLQAQQEALLKEKLALEQLRNKVGKSLPSLQSSKDDKLVMAASSRNEDQVQKIVRVEVNSKVEVNAASS